MVSVLLKKNVASVYDVEGIKLNTCECICETEDKNIVSLLLLKGANPSVCDASGKTPLMYACTQVVKCTKLLSMLLRNRSDVIVRDNAGTTPLMYACVYNTFRFVTKLLDMNADIFDCDFNGKTVLMYACENRLLDFEFVRLLIDKGVNKYICDQFGKTALMFLCEADFNQYRLDVYQCNQYDIELQLVSVALNVLLPTSSCRDDMGNTALMLACKTENLFQIQLMLDRGVDPYILDHSGRTALMVVKEEGRRKKNKIVTMFSKNGVVS